EHLAMDGEYVRVVEMTDECADRIATYPNIIIEEQDKIVCGQPESAVARDAESGIGLVAHKGKIGRTAGCVRGRGPVTPGGAKSLRHKPFASGIYACVVNDHNLDGIAVTPRIAMASFEHRRQEFL